MCMCMCVALAVSKPNPDRKGFLCRWSAQLDPHCAWSTAISLDVKCIIPHLSFMKASGGYRAELNRTGSTAWENVFCKYRTGCEQSFQNNLGYRTTYQWCQMTINNTKKKNTKSHAWSHRTRMKQTQRLSEVPFWFFGVLISHELIKTYWKENTVCNYLHFTYKGSGFHSLSWMFWEAPSTEYVYHFFLSFLEEILTL